MKTIINFSLAIVILAALFLPISAFAKTALASLFENVSVDEEDPGKPRKKKHHGCCQWSRPDRLFKEGQIDATIGIGLVPTFMMDGATTKLLPLIGSLEYRFGEKFSLGLMAGHSICESKPKSVGNGDIRATWTNHFTQLALRPAVHIVKSDTWDIYGGFAIGMSITALEGKCNSTEFDLPEYESHVGIRRNKSDFLYTGFLGVRYVMSPKWMLGAEAGLGVSIFTVGATRLLN